MKYRILEKVYSTHKRYTPQRKCWYGKWIDDFPLTFGCSHSSSSLSLDTAANVLKRDVPEINSIPVVTTYVLK